MAMITCPECQAEVSDTALKCPKCGAKLRELKRSLFGNIVKWTFILFNIFMLIWVGNGCSVTSSASGAAETLGAGIGMGILFGLWFVGDVILGILTLLTRPHE